ncbi:TadE family protein [Nitrolancea hollandica]|uniref:TadE-like domain-containing protein n=1 Tax=Nitrolancea hollandica Lb TaxID=1129897 RepID=I4EL57_9BACT|nr:TadE family protein [Nitrolancea hollandica]CCF85419.1 hypothetical protein NITHO_4950002 [Nitrolancea hollandica Lb]
MSARARNLMRRRQGCWREPHTGQALVELALVIPVLLLLAFGVLGVGRVLQAKLAVSATAREAARAATMADSAPTALTAGLSRGETAAAGYGLGNGSLEVVVDPGQFERGGQVRAMAHYTVTLDDLPLLGWVRVPVASDHVERIGLYRSRRSRGGTP